MRKKLTIGLLAAVSAALIVLDQITKSMAASFLRDAGPTTVIPGLLEFSYLENTAAAMGLFEGMIVPVMVLSAVVAAAIAAGAFLYKDHTWASRVSSVLLFSGGVGNLIDRIKNVGPAGERFVVDFIHIEFFPYIFNIADCCVTIGAAFFLIHFVISARRSKDPAGLES